MTAEIPALGWDEVTLRVATAAALGAAIGLERELREREAGLRTHLLVSVGSALFTIVSAYGFHEFLVAGGNVVRTDPTRIAAQIVSGIGFLGAGAIIRQGFAVRGLTTAATLWVVAAIGMAAGAGYYSAAVITTAVALVSLWPLRVLFYRWYARVQPERARLAVEVESGPAIGPVLACVEEAGATVSSVSVARAREGRSVELEVELPRDVRDRVFAGLASLAEVREVRWMA